jgi:hypothetical protein
VEHSKLPFATVRTWLIRCCTEIKRQSMPNSALSWVSASLQNPLLWEANHPLSIREGNANFLPTAFILMSNLVRFKEK